MSPRVRRANFLYDQGRTIEAEVELRAALSEGDDSSYVHALLGLCLLKAHLVDDAQHELKEALAREPNSAFNHYAMSFVQEAAITRTDLFGGRRKILLSDEGRQCLESALRAVELEPETPLYLVRVAELYQDQERWKESIGPAETALRQSPGDCSAAVKLAEALIRLRRASEARAVLHRALEMNPAKSLAHAGMGWALLRAGDYQRAEKFFQEALRMHADSAWAQAGALECAKQRYRIYRWLWRSEWWFRTQSVFVAAPIVIGLICVGLFVLEYFPFSRFLDHWRIASLSFLLISCACTIVIFRNAIFLWFVRRHVAAQTSLGTQRRRFALRTALVVAAGGALVLLNAFVVSKYAQDCVLALIPAAIAVAAVFKTFPAGKRRRLWLAYLLIPLALTLLFVPAWPQSTDPGPSAGFIFLLVLPYVPLFIACDAEKKKALKREHAAAVAKAGQVHDP